MILWWNLSSFNNIHTADRWKQNSRASTSNGKHTHLLVFLNPNPDLRFVTKGTIAFKVLGNFQNHDLNSHDFRYYPSELNFKDLIWSKFVGLSLILKSLLLMPQRSNYYHTLSLIYAINIIWRRLKQRLTFARRTTF